MRSKFWALAVLFASVLSIVKPNDSAAAVIPLVNSTFSTTDTEGWFPLTTGSVVAAATADTNYGANAPVLAVTNSVGAGAIARGAVAFPATTLVDTGDYIQADYDVRVVGLAGGVSRIFQSAFYNNNGTTQPGYIADLRMSNPGSYVAGFENALRDSPSVGISGGKPVDPSLIGSPPTTSLGTSATKVRHFTLKITKTETGVDLSYIGGNDSTGTVSLSASDATPWLTFNTLDLNVKGNTVAFNVDNVVVVASIASIPEPSSLALLGVAVGGLLVRRRVRGNPS